MNKMRIKHAESDLMMRALQQGEYALLVHDAALSKRHLHRILGIMKIQAELRGDIITDEMLAGAVKVWRKEWERKRMRKITSSLDPAVFADRADEVVIRPVNWRLAKGDFIREGTDYKMSAKRILKELRPVAEIFMAPAFAAVYKTGIRSTEVLNATLEKYRRQFAETDPETYAFGRLLIRHVTGRFYSCSQVARVCQMPTKNVVRWLKKKDVLIFPYVAGRRKWNMINEINLAAVWPELKRELAEFKGYRAAWAKLLRKALRYTDYSSAYQFMLRKEKKGIVPAGYFDRTRPTRLLLRSFFPGVKDINISPPLSRRSSSLQGR